MRKRASYQLDTKKHSYFSLLPDEIIMSILSQPIMDLKSLVTITTLSKRFCQLGFHAIILNYLQTIQLSTLIDQEGHGLFTTVYKFSHVDSGMFSATFESISPISKRYYSNKEAPTLRHTSIIYQLNDDSLSSTSLDKLEYEKNNNKLEKNQNGPSSKLALRSSKPPTFTNQQQPVIQVRNRKIQGQKQGVHQLLVTRMFPFSNHPVYKYNSVSNRRFSWKLVYDISDSSNGSKNEYYLTPLQLTIQLNHFVRMESSNENWNKKFKRWMNELIHS